MIDKDSIQVYKADYYIGLDNSLTCTGLTILDSAGDKLLTKVIIGEKVAKKWGSLVGDVLGNSLRKQQFSKMLGIREEILLEIDSLKGSVCIGVENYSYASKGKQTLLGELGGIVREGLFKNCNKIFEIAPQAVKKFVTGSGTAPKDLVLMKIYKDYNEEFEDIKGQHKTDAADSFSVAKVCYHFASGDISGLTKNQLEVIAKIRETENK